MIMLSARVLSSIVLHHAGKYGLAKPINSFSQVREMAQQVRSGLFRRSRSRTLKEFVATPTHGATPINIGQGAVAGFAVISVGALAFYGLGLSDEPGAIDRHLMWSNEVRQRIRDTYLYFGASVATTAVTASAVFRTPALMNIVSRGGWLALGASFAAMIGSGMLVRSLPYKPESPIGIKQMAWLLHCSVVGAVVAPICLMGGNILIRAAWYTAGMVGSLSAVAACAPSDKFLQMGGPLAMGLGVVFVSSIGSAFLPATSTLGLSLYSVALYGGLVVFGGFLLYDTQKIIRRAESHPTYGYNIQPYDPINNSIGIYMDTINIFIRVVQMLAMGGSGRKK